MKSLVQEDKKYFLNVYNRLNLEIVKGEGSYLYDGKGNKYLDMFSGISVNNLGHDPELNQQIIEQVQKYVHLSNFFAAEPVVNLARLLVENTFASKVFFVNSGTEANEAAIKLARKFGRQINEDKVELLSANNSFHGRTCGGLSLTGQPRYQDDFRPLIPGVKNFRYNDQQDLKDKVSDKTCAVFIEMIQGQGGVVEISQQFIDTLVNLAEEHRFLIIVDEIQTGLGRTGDIFAFEKYGFQPDLVTVAKSLGGGLPLGAMLVSQELEDILGPGDHGSTFGGNPVACAAGEYLFSKIVNDDFRAQIQKKSQLLLNRLAALKEYYPTIINDIRGRGLMLGIDTGEYAPEVREKAMEKGLLLNVTSSSVVRLLPALNITEDELIEFLNIFKEILDSLKTS
mgnify:CR=1 FL=1